ncbi:MAG TPA: outer membrane beta-barrel protein [Flavobacterium lutivivi]|jgi:opacity protein-like surface antigen|nr:outer membrane beta-barrel protein [Flavobacterium lutivivi]
MKLGHLFFFLLLSSIISAQTSKFSVEAGYPIPVGDNFLENYTGIANLNLKYRIKNLEVVNIGLSLNANMLQLNDTGYFPAYDETLSFKTNLFIIQPKVFTEINLKKINKLHPSVGLGYSFFLANAKFDSPEISNLNTNESGFNLSLGLSYDIISKLYVFANYDYNILTKLEPIAPKSSYNSRPTLMQFGMGLRF